MTVVGTKDNAGNTARLPIRSRRQDVSAQRSVVVFPPGNLHSTTKGEKLGGRASVAGRWAVV